MNRVFYGVWGIMTLTVIVLNLITLSRGFTWMYGLATVCQVILLVFIIGQYRRLDREAARRKRQARRTKRFAEQFGRRDHPFKMPKVGE